METATVALCECGCGNPAPIAARTYKHAGVRKGEPYRFIRGHTWGGKTLSAEHRLKVSDGLKAIGHQPSAAAVAKAIAQRDYKGANHPQWGGGRTKNSYGYIEVYAPEHPNAHRGGYVYEHRIVVEREIGRYLDREEIVHHVNHMRDDNRRENLQVMSLSEHARLHAEEGNHDHRHH